MLRDKFKYIQDTLRKKHDLTDSQIEALIGFKTRQCVDLNSKIRSNKMLISDVLLAQYLNEALTLLPRCLESKVYRNLSFIDSQHSMALQFFELHVGKLVQFPDFLSCTKLKYFAGESNPSDWVFEITLAQDSNSRDFQTFWITDSGPDPEQKVAFTQNSCFEVLKVNPRDYIQVYLHERDCSPDATLVPNF